jgi:hypothetical protein
MRNVNNGWAIQFLILEINSKKEIINLHVYINLTLCSLKIFNRQRPALVIDILTLSMFLPC